MPILSFHLRSSIPRYEIEKTVQAMPCQFFPSSQPRLDRAEDEEDEEEATGKQGLLRPPVGLDITMRVLWNTRGRGGVGLRG